MHLELRKEDQIISYLTLRKLIGLMGIILPILLPLGVWILGGDAPIQDSISDYYYTKTGNVLVGILFVLGFFLLSYKGYDNQDNFIANLGFLFALGVALFPCQSEFKVVWIIHFASATLLFLVFIWFSLIQFTKSLKEAVVVTKSKRQSNAIYIACGWIMIACIVIIGISLFMLSERQRANINIVYWLESTALWAFGYSWLTKGKFMQEK